MAKLYLMMFMVCIFLFAYLVAKVINAHEVNLLNEHRALMDNWVDARAARINWLKKNNHLPQPHLDPEYEELWNTEIGAEELLFICYGITHRVSYQEYREEKEQQKLFDEGESFA